MLAKAGCVYARIAFEAASDYVRNAVFRKNTTRKQLTDAAGWIKKYGIRLCSLNMLGGPGGTLEDELDTIRLNIECKVDHPMVSLMQRIRADIADMARTMGYAGRHTTTSPRSQPHSSIQSAQLEIENCTSFFSVGASRP